MERVRRTSGGTRHVGAWPCTMAGIIMPCPSREIDDLGLDKHERNILSCRGESRNAPLILISFCAEMQYLIMTG